MSGGTILVVDDDRSIRQYLSDLLTGCGYTVEAAESGEQALARLHAGLEPDAVLLDVVIPGADGLEILARIRDMRRFPPVIMLSAVDQIKTVVEAMRAGASDYITKPFQDEELELAIENVLEKQKLKNEVISLRQQLENEPQIVSSHPRILRLKEISRHVADADVPVLILGESGVGKEVLARYIHTVSERRDKPFVKVNCAALPEDLLESELFGYERGAFTGAQTDKPGKFEMANGGCLLLDEIGEMSPQLQAKLLHVLQDGNYTRLGGRRTLRTDARIIAATNCELDRAVQDGSFRSDLYFRLNVIRIEVPPLRERKEDIPLFCNYFLHKFRVRYRSRVDHIPKDLVEAFVEYDWPGNVRQLENVVKRYLILGETEMILNELQTPRKQPAARTENLPLKALAANAAESAEKDAVLRALELTHWNRKKAARQLCISYKALLNKLKKWQLHNRASVGDARAWTREVQ